MDARGFFAVPIDRLYIDSEKTNLADTASTGALRRAIWIWAGVRGGWSPARASSRTSFPAKGGGETSGFCRFPPGRRVRMILADMSLMKPMSSMRSGFVEARRISDPSGDRACPASWMSRRRPGVGHDDSRGPAWMALNWAS